VVPTLPGHSRQCYLRYEPLLLCICQLTSLALKVGLLPKGAKDKVSDAYNRYYKWANLNNSDREFKDTSCRRVTIDFIGVW